MTGIDLIFQLFALLLGLSIAELLAGLGRSWRIRAGVTKAGTPIRIGWLVPLLGLLLLCDQTHFWISAYGIRDYQTFSYWTMLVIVMIIGGYYIISTFVFPDEPADWPDFDDYYLATNRIVVGGMFAANLAILAYLGYLISIGLKPSTLPFAQHWTSLAAVFFYFPGLVALWYVKSSKANLVLLLFMIGLLMVGALGPTL